MTDLQTSLKSRQLSSGDQEDYPQIQTVDSEKDGDESTIASEGRYYYLNEDDHSYPKYRSDDLHELSLPEDYLRHLIDQAEVLGVKPGTLLAHREIIEKKLAIYHLS